MIKRLIDKCIRILKNPEKEFGALHTQTLETVVFDYLQLLVGIAVVAGIITFIYSLIRTVYLDIFLSIDINYIRFLNFALGQASGTALFYILGGTFLMFPASLILTLFFRRIRYAELLKKMLYAATPILTFGWVPKIALALFVWCIFLFYVGLRTHKQIIIAKTSIERRE